MGDGVFICRRCIVGGSLYIGGQAAERPDSTSGIFLRRRRRTCRRLAVGFICSSTETGFVEAGPRERFVFGQIILPQ